MTSFEKAFLIPLTIALLAFAPFAGAVETTWDENQPVTTCTQYLKQPCDCGLCSWFYLLQDVCHAQNLTHCVKGGYYDGGSHESDCCSPDYAKMIIITVIVVALVACWCLLVAGIILLKRRQKRKRQRGALDSVLLPNDDPTATVAFDQPYAFDDEDNYGPEWAPPDRMESGVGGFAVRTNTAMPETGRDDREASDAVDFADSVNPGASVTVSNAEGGLKARSHTRPGPAD